MARFLARYSPSPRSGAREVRACSGHVAAARRTLPDWRRTSVRYANEFRRPRKPRVVVRHASPLDHAANRLRKRERRLGAFRSDPFGSGRPRCTTEHRAVGYRAVRTRAGAVTTMPTDTCRQRPYVVRCGSPPLFCSRAAIEHKSRHRRYIDIDGELSRVVVIRRLRPPCLGRVGEWQK